MVAAQSLSTLMKTDGLPAQPNYSLQQFIDAPIEKAEWVDGQVSFPLIAEIISPTELC